MAKYFKKIFGGQLKKDSSISFNNKVKNSENFTPSSNNLILIDVDDTISPSQYNSNKRQYVSEWNGVHSISDELFEDIESLPGDKVWLTSWTGDAEDTFKRGWHFLEWNEEDLFYEWKLKSLNSFLNLHPNYRKIVWLDNDLSYWSDSINYENGIEYLLIAPENYKGLTPENVKKAKIFLEG